MTTDLTPAAQTVLDTLIQWGRDNSGEGMTTLELSETVERSVPGVARILGSLRSAGLVDQMDGAWFAIGVDEEAEEAEEAEGRAALPVVANPASAPKESRWRFGVRCAIAHRAIAPQGRRVVAWVIAHPVTGEHTEVMTEVKSPALPTEKACSKCGVVKALGEFGTRTCASVAKRDGELVLTHATIRAIPQCKQCRRNKKA